MASMVAVLSKTHFLSQPITKSLNSNFPFAAAIASVSFPSNLRRRGGVRVVLIAPDGGRLVEQHTVAFAQTENRGDKPKQNNTREDLQNQRASANANGEANGKIDDEMIDLNANPQRVHEPASNNQGIDVNNNNNNEPAAVVPVGPFQRESNK